MIGLVTWQLLFLQAFINNSINMAEQLHCSEILSKNIEICLSKYQYVLCVIKYTQNIASVNVYSFPILTGSSVVCLITIQSSFGCSKRHIYIVNHSWRRLSSCMFTCCFIVLAQNFVYGTAQFKF